MRWIALTTCLMAIPLLRADDPSYQRDVRPILDKNCTSCHQPAKKQSDLDLTTYAGFQAGGKRGPAFVARSPEQSLVIQLITASQKPAKASDSTAIGTPARAWSRKLIGAPIRSARSAISRLVRLPISNRLPAKVESSPRP